MTNLKRVLSIFLIFFVVFLMNFVCVDAVDLNLTENTSSNINSSNSVNENTENNYNSTSNNSVANSSYNTTQNVEPSTTSATVRTGDLSSSSDLRITNILNIFLIVVGIILILLAIAILIKLKN